MMMLASTFVVRRSTAQVRYRSDPIVRRIALHIRLSRSQRSLPRVARMKASNVPPTGPVLAITPFAGKGAGIRSGHEARQGTG
jgi:hypothetical protein